MPDQEIRAQRYEELAVQVEAAITTLDDLLDEVRGLRRSRNTALPGWTDDELTSLSRVEAMIHRVAFASRAKDQLSTSHLWLLNLARMAQRSPQ